MCFVFLSVSYVLVYYNLLFFVKCVGSVTCVPRYNQAGSAGNIPNLLSRGYCLSNRAGNIFMTDNLCGFSQSPKAISFTIHPSLVTPFNDVCSTAERIVK